MYYYVDNRWHKTFLKYSLKSALLSFFLISSFAFAGAAEDRTNSVINSAINSKYSSATGKDYTVGNVVVKDGILSADIKQKVIVDGSSATVGTKVSIPANDAFYKQSAKYAKGLLKNSAYAYAASVGMETLLRGVDYVMGEGGIVTRLPSENDAFLCSSNNCTSQYIWKMNINNITASNTSLSLIKNEYEKYLNKDGFYTKIEITITSTSKTDTSVTYNHSTKRTNTYGQTDTVNGALQYSRINNSNYNPSAPSQNIIVSDSEIEDAFSNWFKNNPTSVTDPVNTYIYSGKASNGTPVSQPQSPPSFGQNTITDEMMDNYLENRDAMLRSANDQARREAIHSDSTKESADTTPKTSTKTETLSDGSTRKTDTKTETLPDGSTKTTETVTTTKPDGSTSTTTSEQITSPVAEKSIPPACEYFAILCDWLNWTKENPDIPDDSELPTIQNIEVGQLDTNTFKATPGCPAPYLIDMPFGKGGNFSISYEPICQFAEKWSFVAPLIGFFSGALIIVGVGRRGEDSEI